MAIKILSMASLPDAQDEPCRAHRVGLHGTGKWSAQIGFVFLAARIGRAGLQLFQALPHTRTVIVRRNATLLTRGLRRALSPFKQAPTPALGTLWILRDQVITPSPAPNRIGDLARCAPSRRAA